MVGTWSDRKLERIMRFLQFSNKNRKREKIIRFWSFSNKTESMEGKGNFQEQNGFVVVDVELLTIKMQDVQL